MKLKYQFVVTDVAGEFNAVAVDEGANAFHGVIRLNKEGCAVFTFLGRGEMSLEKLLYLMGKCFDESSASEIRAKTVPFLRWLYANGLLIVEEGELA